MSEQVNDKYAFLRAHLPELVKEAARKGAINPRAQMIIDLLADYDALHAEAEALRAENERVTKQKSARQALSIQLIDEARTLRTELEAARGLLAQLRGMINCTVENDTEKMPVWISTKHPVIEQIDTFLTATPAPEAPDHTERNLEMAEQGERQEAVPEETPHIIVFDDADRPNEVFSGAGARPAALRRWEQISVSWNAHLFVRVEKNSRDDPNPCARLATIPQPGPDVRALVHAAKKVITWLDWSAGLPGEDGEYMHVDVQALRSAVERLEQQGEHS